MSNRAHPDDMYLAPGARYTARMELPGDNQSAFPSPDDHLVEPETDREMIDGEVMRVLPALPPHADRQFDISYVLRANVADGYVGSTELLTRVSQENDFATDACIRKQGEDAHGHRYLEELSFEIKYTQSAASLKQRARYLIRRGVRRVFAIYVRLDERDGNRVVAGPVKEWTESLDDFVELAKDSYIEDPCLQRPLEVAALVEALEADKAVARGLIHKRNPVVLELQADSYDQGKSDGYDQGKLEGLQQTVRALCQAFDIVLTPERSARLNSLGMDELLALVNHLQEHRSWVNAGL